MKTVLIALALLFIYSTVCMNFQLTDWIVLIVTLLAVMLYGIYKSRTSKNLEGYFLSNRSMPWYLVLLSIMGTQASAITFLTAPGQAYTDGMGFIQNYFGLPLAMIVLSVTFIPMFKKLNVYTAYEFLEKRFDIFKKRPYFSAINQKEQRVIEKFVSVVFTITSFALYNLKKFFEKYNLVLFG